MGAIWNISAGALFIFASLFIPSLFELFETQEPDSFVWYYNFFLLVIVLGIGYYWVGQDLSNNQGIVKMGILRKFSVVVLLTIYFILGDFGWLVLLPATIDFVFAILYLEFLKNFSAK
ncbi:MAG: hypothetical protein GPJ54_03305 [Candidatus Heimdallarchaeota archaeon]|nr:hypothetical protein [Candidatus Heimdallarchaeota archaeon]